MQAQQPNYRNLKCAISSFFANYISGILHPLDVIKTRFQSHDGKLHHNIVPKYGTIMTAFKEIYKDQGLKGFFKGFYMSLLSQALASSFFFWLYQQRKDAFLDRQLGFMNAVTLASLQAGVIATIVTQPFWVIKTRMLLNVNPNISEVSNCMVSSSEIYSHHGFRGFMKGLSINIVLAVIGISQMYIYEGSKVLYDKLNIPQTTYSQKNFISGGVSKIVSGLIMYPFTTVRTRIQQNQYINNSKEQKYKGIWDVTSKTWKSEGVHGFYKGLGANILKGIPQKGIYFYFYELIKEKGFGLKQHKGH